MDSRRKRSALMIRFRAAVFRRKLAMSYSCEQKGSLNTPEFRVFFKNEEGSYISPVHDIPLWQREGEAIANMIVEIPRWSHAKLEVSPLDPLNPIHHDVDKSGNLRYVANTFPSHGYLWNYGCLPQTWEDPNHVDSLTKYKGDGDPVDVIDIGSQVHSCGEVVQIKVLGSLAMIDEGQTDWKVIGIDANDPLAVKMSDVSDIDVYMPDLLRMTTNWFRIYKIADGKPANKFAFNARSKNKSFTLNVLRETHQQWCSLMASKKEMKFCRTHTTSLAQLGKASIIGSDAAKDIVSKHPDAGPTVDISDPKVHLWHHVATL